MQEIGLFCGSFNPIHMGHLLMAECARDQFQLKKVLFVTSSKPPHRSKGLLDMEARHELVCAAIKDNQHFEASRLELDRPGQSFTIDTIRLVRTIYQPGTTIKLIVGEDNLAYMGQWHEAKEIFQLCQLLVAPRTFPSPNPKYESISPLPFDQEAASIKILDFPLVPISASLIRHRLSEGRSVRYMVAPEVHEIIVRRGYYKDSQFI